MFTLIQSRRDFEDMWRALDNEPLVSVDTETTGREWWCDKIVGASFANMERAFYMPIRHDEANVPVSWLRECGERLEGRLICGHNIGGFDFHLLRREGWKIPALYHDSQIAAYTLDENQRLKLEELASSHLGIDGDAEERQLYADLAAYFKVRLTKGKLSGSYKAKMCHLHPARVLAYAARDALSSRQLMQKLWTDLGNAGLRTVYQSLIEYDRVLHDIRENGVHVDLARLNAADAIVSAKADELAAEIVRQSGVENPRSNPQLAKWCGTDSVSKKKLAKVLADPDVDEALPPKIELIRERALYDKAHGTYYTVMRESLDGDVLHPALRLTGAAVRLSCGRPPMQGIPRYGQKTHAAYRGIKECIVAPGGQVFAEFDLSQAEIVMGAFYSRDEVLLAAIESGRSVHDIIAERDRIDREVAKQTNFALQYGCGAPKFAEIRMISLEQAKTELAAYHRTMAGQRRFYDHAQRVAAHYGKIVLWSGRERHYGPDVALHSASNNYIQGGVSELIRVATVRCHREVPEFRMGLTVHDSLVGYMVDDAHQEEISREVLRILTDFQWLDPKIKADVKRGKSWATAK